MYIFFSIKNYSKVHPDGTINDLKISHYKVIINVKLMNLMTTSALFGCWWKSYWPACRLPFPFLSNKGGYVPSNDDFDIVHSRQWDVVMVITKEKLFTTFLMAIHFARLIQRLPPVNLFLFDCVWFNRLTMSPIIDQYLHVWTQSTSLKCNL